MWEENSFEEGEALYGTGWDKITSGRTGARGGWTVAALGLDLSKERERRRRGNCSVGAIHNLLVKRVREIYDLMGRGVVPQDKGDESNEPVGVLTC